MTGLAVAGRGTEGRGPAAGLRALARGAARLWRDRRGVAAVEFALIAPVLMCMYFVSMEVSQAIETSKKVSRVGSMVADLVTQQSLITKTDADAILAIGGALLLPYNRSKPTITITAIQITNEASPKVLVSWSRKLSNGATSAGAAAGTAITVPANLKVAGTFLVRVDSALTYSPVITWAASSKKALGLASAFDSISMGNAYYLRPRMSDTVTCGDC